MQRSGWLPRSSSVHEVEPALERVQPAASTSRHGEALGQVGDAADVAGRCRMLERLLDCADLDGPARRGTVQCARLLRLGSLELPREEVADDAGVAVAAPAVVEGDRHAGAFEGLEHLRRVGPSEERVALLRRQLREDGRLHRELPLRG